MTPDPSDLASLDRDVARAASALRGWTRDLRLDPERFADVRPIERWRHVAGKSTYDSLRALSPAAGEAPLRDGLMRWVAALLLSRIAHEVDVEREREAHAAAARVLFPEPRATSWRQAWRELVMAPTTRERASWLEAIVARGPAMAAVTRRRAQRRDEAARRLGLEHEDAWFTVSRGVLVTAARDLLDRTQDLTDELLRAARRKGEMELDPPRAVDAFAIAVARDAPEGWPARLSPTWLEATFGPLIRGLRIDLPDIPAAIGAASFARACAAFGASFRAAASSPSLPFGLARDPFFTAAHRFGFVFGALPASPAFQRRVLCNGARIAANQARALARTALLEARLEAARYLTSRAPSAVPFDELTHRLFGAPLPIELEGAWPGASDEAPARLLALLTAAPLAKELVERFDDDWFVNPRAMIHLRAIASGPAREAPSIVATRVATPLVGAFVEALA